MPWVAGHGVGRAKGRARGRNSGWEAPREACRTACVGARGEFARTAGVRRGESGENEGRSLGCLAGTKNERFKSMKGSSILCFGAMRRVIKICERLLQ